jgi:acetyltransferase
VKGFRGAPAVDVDALVDLVLRLARIAEYLPEVSELDLNPVIAFPEGYVPVDARVRLRRPEGAASIKGW